MPQNINHIVHSQNEHNKDSRNLLKDIKELLTIKTNSTQDFNVPYNGNAFLSGSYTYIDCVGYKSIRIWGNTTGPLEIEGTNALNTGNAGFWDSLGDDIQPGKFSLYFPDPPRNIRIGNTTGGSHTLVNIQYGRIK